MPRMDGFQTCQKIKANEATKDIPVIFMTAFSDEENMKKAFLSGGVDYITKPINREELITRVTTQLKIQKYNKSLEEEVLKSHQRLALFVESFPGFVYRRKNNKTLSIEYMSEGCKNVTGYSPGEIINNPDFNFFNIICEKDREIVLESLRKAISEKKIL